MNLYRTHIRDATLEDLPEITRTLVDLQRLSEGFYPEPDLAWASHLMIDSIARRYVGVALSGLERVVGVACLSREHFKWVDPANPRGHFLTTDHFWVDPDYRKYGTAKKLVDWTKERADEEGLRLHVQMFTPDESAKTKDRFVANQGFVYQGGNFIRSPLQKQKPSSSPDLITTQNQSLVSGALESVGD